MSASTERVYLYDLFERFWHWSQAGLVIALAITGFDIHFSGIELMPFEAAVLWHRYLAIAFLVLIIFAIFWHFTTGQWRQYLPTRKFLKEMIEFYVTGIFRGAPHPVKKTQLSKLNPLQRMAYLSLKIILIPALVLTGMLYESYNHWDEIGITGLSLGPVAIVHTLLGFLMIAFMFGHIYLTTTGHTPLSNLKAMVTGWEELEDDDER